MMRDLIGCPASPSVGSISLQTIGINRGMA
jgi:hypothetical protein